MNKDLCSNNDISARQNLSKKKPLSSNKAIIGNQRMVYYTPLPVVMQHDPEIERTTHGCLSSVEPSSHSVFQYNLAPRRAQIINLSNNIAIEDTSNFEQRTPQHDTICQIKVKPNGIDYSQSRESTEILNQTTSYQGMKTPKFECMHCNIYFGSKSAYMSHIKSHTKEQNTLSSTKSIGVRDVRSGQNSRSHLSDQHQCDICKKTFAVPARLIRHYRTHTGERPFECEFCHKMFSVKENLQVHRRIHTKERPYKCNVCERAFEHSGKLHRHMRIHTGERPHKCNVCGKTFIQSGQLVIHMRTHTGEKPYRCPEVGCLKGFTCSKQLKVHSRTHSGEKPYRCDVCGRDFGYNHVLKLHRVQHYGSKCYKCTICEETFKSKKEMEAHIKDHANDTTDDEPLLKKARVFQADQLVSTDESNKEEIVTNREDSYKYRVYQHFESHITSQYAVQSSMNPVALLAAASIVASAQERSEVQPICSAPSISPISLSPCTYNNATNVITNKRQTFSNNLSQGLEFKPLLQSSDELVKRVEAALGCTSMTEPETPPRSSSDQDDRSSSPEYDSLHVHERRDNNTLPPRKRRLYFKDDHENFITTRVSSVIHFAKSK